MNNAGAPALSPLHLKSGSADGGLARDGGFESLSRSDRRAASRVRRVAVDRRDLETMAAGL